VVEANPQVANDTGRVAIQRGPLVYCMEEIDQPVGVSIADLAVNPDRSPKRNFKNDVLGGVVELRHTGVALRSDSIAQCSVLPIQQSSGAEPTGAADVYSLVCMVQSMHGPTGSRRRCRFGLRCSKLDADTG
jgi:hypothetical protein